MMRDAPYIRHARGVRPDPGQEVSSWGAIPQCRISCPTSGSDGAVEGVPAWPLRRSYAEVAFGRPSHFLALLSPHSPVFLRSTEQPGRWSRIRCALLGPLISGSGGFAAAMPFERDVRHTMATTLWRSESLSESCGLGTTSDAYIDAGYGFMRAPWEHPLVLDILVSAWRWWATRPGSWRQLPGRLFSNSPKNGQLGIYALLFQVLKNHWLDHVKKKH